MTYRQDKRVWLAGGVLVAILLVAVGWLMVISPKLSSTNGIKSDITDAQFENVGLRSKVADLRRQNDKVAELRSNLRVALSALPIDSGLPAFTRQLSEQATLSSVKLTSITVGTPTSAESTTKAPSAPSTGTTLVAIPITLISNGRAADQNAFLQAIQTIGPRRALVTSTLVAAVSGTSISKNSTMTVQLNIFSAPMAAAAKAQLDKLLNGK